VYAGDARPGERALLRIPALLPDPEPEFRAATLYGVPAAGRWCTLAFDGAMVVPFGPASTRMISFAPSYGLTPPGERTREERAAAHDLPLRVEEIRALRVADREGLPDEVRHHARTPLTGYAGAAAMAMAGSALVKFLPALSYPFSLLIAGLALAASSALAWRAFMRARIAWNGHGIAAIGVFGSRRVPWREVRAIDYSKDVVTVHTGQTSLVVSAAPRFRFLGRSDRTAQELANALRHARSTARPVDPRTGDELAAVPRLEAPRVPAGLYLLWLVGTPLLAWAIHAQSAM
jgi:hypothetical protein